MLARSIQKTLLPQIPTQFLPRPGAYRSRVEGTAAARSSALKTSVHNSNSLSSWIQITHIHVGVLGLLHRKEAISLDLKLLETIGRLEGKGYRLQRQPDPASASIGGVKQGRTTKKLWNYHTTFKQNQV